MMQQIWNSGYGLLIIVALLGIVFMVAWIAILSLPTDAASIEKSSTKPVITKTNGQYYAVYPCGKTVRLNRHNRKREEIQ